MVVLDVSVWELTSQKINVVLYRYPPSFPHRRIAKLAGVHGQQVGVVGRAKLRAVNVEGKPLAGVAMAGDSVGSGRWSEIFLEICSAGGERQTTGYWLCRS